MAYMYIQPNEGFDKRYLVIRSVTVTVSNSPVNPQVGVLLARWYNAKLHDHWSTTAPAPPDGGSVYQLEAKSGYLLTRADPTKATVELEDCVSHWPGHPDHILKHKGNCEAAQYQRLRSVGWAYSARQPGSQPLYACYADAEKSHFASSREDCEGLGAKGTLLGYDLKE